MRKSGKERVESLLRQAKQLKAKAAEIQAKEQGAKRKQETRVKIIIGAALMADAKVSTVTADLLADVLRRAVTADRDRALLQAVGWLAEKESGAGGATAKK